MGGLIPENILMLRVGIPENIAFKREKFPQEMQRIHGSWYINFKTESQADKCLII